MRSYFVETISGFVQLSGVDGKIGRTDWGIWETDKQPILDKNRKCLNPEILTKTPSVNGVLQGDLRTTK